MIISSGLAELAGALLAIAIIWVIIPFALVTLYLAVADSVRKRARRRRSTRCRS